MPERYLLCFRSASTIGTMALAASFLVFGLGVVLTEGQTSVASSCSRIGDAVYASSQKSDTRKIC